MQMTAWSRGLARTSGILIRSVLIGSSSLDVLAERSLREIALVVERACHQNSTRGSSVKAFDESELLDSGRQCLKP